MKNISELAASERGRLVLLVNGALVALVGLISGFGFVFEILNSISVWPVSFEINGDFPGSERGWRVAHVAGVMNGMLIILAALMLPHIQASLRSQCWIVRGLIYTGWGNTLFFHFANFSNNRGLSAGTTQYGEADWLGVVGYLFGGSTIPFTITAFVLIAISAYTALKK
ncbi:MAG: hypothetical protein V7785_22210 [Bermanella sp.]